MGGSRFGIIFFVVLCIECLLGALSLGIKSPVREADNLIPFTFEAEKNGILLPPLHVP
jgi:hypothetical protein